MSCSDACAQGATPSRWAKGDLVVARRNLRLQTADATKVAIQRGQHLVVEAVDDKRLQVDDGSNLGWLAATAVTRSPRKPNSVSFTLDNLITPDEATELVSVTMLVPRTIPGRQTIRSIEYSRAPDRVFRKHGNAYAIFLIPDLEEPVRIRVDIAADVYRYDLATAMKDAAKPAKGADPDLSRWLRSEPWLQSDDPAIRSAAKKVKGKTDLARVRNTMKYVVSVMSYSGYQQDALGATRALREQAGDCTDYADLFVALCRAKGVPARTCDGFRMVQPRKGDTAKHKWTEVYLKSYGWVPMDPLMVELGGRTERMSNDYVLATRLRSDPIIENYEFLAYRYYGEPITFEDQVLVARR